ncbi:hypothetical protein PORCRE_259 [Porphyromonas crevioricanis JCM 15906]|uniref:Uncharacterized protein n=1 Tax=Porphyromonas crevioricanis JCM 15906 TaxID=1305617 RepID=S4N9D3_9PORP|nr:hypothetical protein PORCRE_259 [Porphyromonas crevioricanis JCM 15906]GAD06939.1 hypothetical protein PORCAN_549 [Porphyromonas crevioricanis JCM 13913]
MRYRRGSIDNHLKKRAIVLLTSLAEEKYSCTFVSGFTNGV